MKAPARVRGRLKEFEVKWETFYFTIYVVIGPHADLQRYMRHRKIDYSATEFEPSSLAGLYFNGGGRRRGVLWLAAAPRTPQQIGFLAHEMFHAVMDLVKRKAFRLNTKTEEAIAYALTYGVEEVLRAVRNGR
jgi:hypothetical protein